MLRHEWKFPFVVEHVFGGVRKKLTHHTERLDWWTTKKEHVLAAIRSEGIEIDESQANLVSNSYERTPTVQIKPELQKDLQECVSKIKEHRNWVAQYAAWEQVLGAQHGTTLELHHDDWLYFFGK